MGFGLLFGGYALLFASFFNRYVLPLAALVQWIGLRRLRLYYSGMRLARQWSMGVFLCALVTLAVQVIGMLTPLGSTAWLAYVQSAADMTCTLGMLGYTLFLLRGIWEAGSETGLASVSLAALRYRVPMTAYYLLSLLLDLPLGDRFPQVALILAIAVTLIGFGMHALMLRALYTCYMYICMPGEEDLSIRKQRRGRRKKSSGTTDERKEG